MILGKYIAEKIIIDEIDRLDMPQISSDNISNMLKIFNQYYIPYNFNRVLCSKLLPIQNNVDQNKVDKIIFAISSGEKMPPIIISNDFYIIDGHHRWIAYKQLNKNNIDVIKIGYPKLASLKLFSKISNNLTENINKISKIICVYSGRFQPFHAGHYYSYEHLVKKFGNEDVYIATSDKINDIDSPFNFSDKQKIISTMFGIPKSKIIKVKNTYAPSEILNKFDKDTTAFIVGVGEKDGDRLGGKYYLPYKNNIKLNGYDKNGYVYIVPQLQLKIKGKLISGTIIRNKFNKELFKSLYPKYNEDIYKLILSKLKLNTTENIILEGGSYGHLAHPFEDNDLTFGDLKNMVNSALEGKLELTQEKTDGQNLMFSWIDGKLKVARNSSHIKNFGKSALDVKGISNMFAGRGEIQTAFTEATKDLENAIKNLSPAQKEKIFKNGKKFMSVEIIYPQTINVIPYGISMLVFHGTREYDKDGNIITGDKEDANILAGMIKQINSDVQNTFKIRAPNNLVFPKVQNFSTQKTYFFNKINILKNKFKLKESDNVMLYHQRWWEDFIQQQAKKFKYIITNDILMSLVKRWAYSDKSIKILDLRKKINNDGFLNWMNEFDKNDHLNQIKINIEPFEKIFLELGARILKNINIFLASNPNQAVNKLKTDLEKSIKDIENSKDVSYINKLKIQLDKLNSIGGIDALIPSEGITFMYNRKLYKLTGTFAPLNQILGMLKYGGR